MSRALIVILLAAACGNVQKQQPDAAMQADAARPTLTVNVMGNGTITSTPAGIDCGTTCSGAFEPGTSITLAAAADPPITFTGWGGACSGTGACTVVLTADTTVTAAFGCTGSMTFDFTGAPQSWSPPCATTVNVDVRGAAGGLAYGGAPLGTATLGGRVQASLGLQTTDVLNIYVGGVGADATATAVGAGGYNGGAAGGAYSTSQFGGGGGGASDIRLNGAAITDRVIVAGGAGGVASCSDTASQGGGGGDLTGADGQKCNASSPDTAATGGTQSAGGTPGSYPSYCTASPGTQAMGGAGCSTGVTGSGGGGGGGGYYGGGGGSWNGGAGGSSYTVSTATNVVHTQAFQSGNGQVVLSW